MNKPLAGKVALITGAARGQGRSHAVGLAEDGADIVLVDACTQFETVNYPLATPEDMAETVRLVEGHGVKAVPLRLDVREPSVFNAAVDEVMAGLPGLDVVVANAGVAPLGTDLPPRVYTDTLGVVYCGVVNTVGAALPHLRDGASVILIGSTAALRASTTEGVAKHGPAGAAYAVGKKALVPLVHDLAYQLGPRSIRVNGVHPGNTNTDLLHNTPMYRVFRPDLAEPTAADMVDVFPTMQRMPVPYMQPGDITGAIRFLASPSAALITGQHLPVDAGSLLLGT